MKINEIDILAQWMKVEMKRCASTTAFLGLSDSPFVEYSPLHLGAKGHGPHAASSVTAWRETVEIVLVDSLLDDWKADAKTTHTRKTTRVSDLIESTTLSKLSNAYHDGLTALASFSLNYLRPKNELQQAHSGISIVISSQIADTERYDHSLLK